MIVKLSPNKWQVQSEKGKNLGTYSSRKAAERRLQQVEYFKHKNHSERDKYYILLKNFNSESIISDPIVEFNDAKMLLLNELLNNKDYVKGYILFNENLVYTLKNFSIDDILNYVEDKSNKFIKSTKKVDTDLYKSLTNAKGYLISSYNHGPKQLIQSIKNPENYKRYFNNAKKKITNTVKNSPEYFKKNPDRILPNATAIPSSVASFIVPIPGVGIVVPAAAYTTVDYGQRKVQRLIDAVKGEDR